MFFTEDTHISLPKAGADSGPVPSSYVLAFWLCNKEEKMDSLKRLAASAVVPVIVLLNPVRVFADTPAVPIVMVFPARVAVAKSRKGISGNG